MKNFSDEELLLLSESELLIELGKYLDLKSGVMRSNPLPKKDLKKKGENWFSLNTSLMKEKVCGNAKIILIIQGGEVLEDAHLVFSIASLFEHILTPLHASIISAIIIKKGIKFLCK